MAASHEPIHKPDPSVSDQDSALARGPPTDRTDFPVIGIGASAGGLDACRKFVDALPAGNGMAFILIQHLDPAHESMMVDLLATHTTMDVRQAKDGMTVEPDHFYVIPPGTYLSVENNILRLSRPHARHGARLPFDFLLHAMAEEYGPRAVSVILSGTGADGSLGLRSIKEGGGLIIAQDPSEASYDGMPRSAISTGAVDIVLAVAKIPDAIIKYAHRITHTRAQIGLDAGDKAQAWLPGIIEILRTKTPHDFTLYKQGTLQRRIERRMAMATVETDGMDSYLEILRNDAGELDLLAKDLLINVTSFFRDPKVFDLLAQKIIPELVRDHTSGRPLRIWVAGCSTGEETYSLAMLFREEITATKSNVTLQVFASDADPDAVAKAREGLYPETIEADITPSRLARFFTKEGHYYRISPALRSIVVFAVQDVLADPPFSRLDLVSCRNLLIYLRHEAQAKVIGVFHFALREGGVLILGRAETIGDADGRFTPISKSERLYRNVGRGRSAEAGVPKSTVRTDFNSHSTARSDSLPMRTSSFADLCQQLVMDHFVPAAILINRRYECLHFMGPTDRYLKIAQGRPIHDLLAMARDGLRTKLRSAIQRACQENGLVVVTGGHVGTDSKAASFSISVQPILSQGEELLLICFKDEPPIRDRAGRKVGPQEVSRVTELEQELEITRTELQGAIHNLELSSNEQKAINEEALSVNEEYQSTNEELLTSKEELQSLNEELTALNNQLQETLDLQRTASNDLKNILFSTNVATIFLDSYLNIRFFTPATRAIFNVIPSDIGRPLADLTSISTDDALLLDAASVLQTLDPAERQIGALNGAWYIRRILPYRTADNAVEGVVITFSDITERKRIADALNAAERQAQLANSAKSRFLAAASHDLRQPLQALALLQGQLAKATEGAHGRELVERLDEMLGAMTGMLDALLDINQIEAGTIRVEKTEFSVDKLLGPLRDEFNDYAQAKGIDLSVVSCGLSITSDPRLLEQMVRNLLSNALKYTSHGKVLLGCRRRGSKLSIEVWDTGVGIPEEELQVIFEEYYQVDNAARERERGLGLGLFIVKQLGALLGHPVEVRSQHGKGSVFTIEALRVATGISRKSEQREQEHGKVEGHSNTGAILVIEDDPSVRELLELLLKDEGHYTAGALDGITALGLVAAGTIRPDLIVADFNLPGGMNGLVAVAKVREKLRRTIPVVILTGDISTNTLSQIASQGCVQLNKPVKPKELTQLIQRLLSKPRSTPPVMRPAERTKETHRLTIFIVDDDSQVCAVMRLLFEGDGQIVETYETCEAFLDAWKPGRAGCLLLDAYLPGMSGLELLRQLRDEGRQLPTIMITGNSDVSMAVEAMKAGALDFVEKPVAGEELLARVSRAIENSLDSARQVAWRLDAEDQLSGLTPRQLEIMKMIVAGHANKVIAADLGISQRTVENHRASIMKKTGSKSLPALARLALVASRENEPVKG
jgi:two-component system CheB/CheR fusion protein